MGEEIGNKCHFKYMVAICCSGIVCSHINLDIAGIICSLSPYSTLFCHVIPSIPTHNAALCCAICFLVAASSSAVNILLPSSRISSVIDSHDFFANITSIIAGMPGLDATGEKRRERSTTTRRCTFILRREFVTTR